MTSPLQFAPAPARHVRPTDVPGVAELQALTQGDRRVCVAVLDGPLDAGHACFAGAALSLQRVPGLEVRGGGAATAHGTLVASILFGQPGSPAPGLVPHCRGLSLPIFGLDEVGGVRPCSQLDLARAIAEAVRWAESLAAAALVINVSGGQFTTSGEAHPLLAKTLVELDSQRVLLVAAAGNDGCDCLHLPGAHPAVLVVGGMDAQGEPLPMSNWGAAYQEHGLLAPGAQIAGAAPGGGLTAGTGTSYATPLVAGAAALLSSWQLAQGRPASAAAVRAALLQSARGCDVQPTADCRRLLSGRLNLSGALEVLRAAPLNPQGDCNMSMVDDNASPKPSGLAADQSCALAPESFEPADAIVPSDCACGGGKGPEYVYAIGSLSYDFGTATRRDSLRQHAEPIHFREKRDSTSLQNDVSLDLNQPKDFLRHILGFREFRIDPANSSAPPTETCRHLPRLNDLKAVHWLLIRDGVNPLYALAPRGPFAELMYEQLAEFLLSQNGLCKADLDVYYALDSSAEPPHVTIVKNPEPPLPVKATPYCAMPGMLLSGEVRLLSGQAVSAITPDQRGTLQWSLDMILEKLLKKTSNDDTVNTAEIAAAAILERLLEEARNPGRTGSDRAKNVFASRVLHGESVASGLDAYVRNWNEVHIGQIIVKRSKNARQGSENYDVEIELFNPDAVQTAMLILSQTVDVADVVPALIDNVRTFRRRQQD